MVNKKYIYLPIGILTTITALAAVMLTSTRVMATCTTENGVTTCDSTSNGDGTQTTDTAVKNARVTVSTTCSFYDANDSYTNTKSATLTAGSYDNTTFANFSNIQVTCNDAGGFAVYAIGNSSENDTTRNMMIGTSGSNINTGLYTSGNTASSWSMRLTNAVNGVSFTNNYGSYHAVPASYEKVATSSAVSGGSTKAGFTTNYDVFPGYDIAAGTYTGSVKYVVVNPSSTVYPPRVYMQNLSAEQCTSTASTVYDSRDNQEYTIKRLEDGKCWMMTNLNLGATTLTTDLTSDNTNLSNTVTAATFNSWKKSSGTATYTAGEYIPITASNSYTGSATDPTSQTAYGTLYNYCAASAGTICTSSNSSNASYDLCPAGWRLPTGNTSGEFQALYSNSNYNTNAKMRAPESSNGAAFALAGRFYDAAPTVQGSYGYYWSSTRVGSTNMYLLYLDTSNVYSDNTNNRDFGFSIRCVLK